MAVKINDMVAVSTSNGVRFGKVVASEKNKVSVVVGGNVITADPRHVSKVYEKNLLKKLINKL